MFPEHQNLYEIHNSAMDSKAEIVDGHTILMDLVKSSTLQILHSLSYLTLQGQIYNSSTASAA